MGQGAPYKVSDRLYIYTDAYDAQNDLRRQSILFDDRIEWLGGGVIQYGKAYYDTAIIPWDKYYPAIAIWYVPSQGGYPGNIGWINDDKNASATVPTVNYSTRAIGSVVRITTAGDHPDMMHSLYYTIGGLNKQLIDTVKSLKDWTIPTGIANQITTSTSGTVVITCESKIGAKLIGTKTVNLTVTIPNNATYKPSISQAIDDNSSVPISWGKWVQNISRAKVKTTASGKYGATISSITTVTPVGTYIGANITTPIIATSGSYKVTTTVKDSRGYTNSSEQVLTIWEYEKPKILSFSAYRANSAQARDANGLYVKQSVTTKAYRLDGYNIPYIRFQHKERAASTYGSYQIYELDNGNSYPERFTGGWAATKSYDLQVTVSDYFNSYNVILSQTLIPTVGTDYDFNENGLGIGKFRERGAIDVTGGIYTDTINGGVPFLMYGGVPNQDYNQAIEPGIYPGTGALNINGPPGNGRYAPLVVMKRWDDIFQITEYGGVIETRMRNSITETWTEWTINS